jgi:hypothetical protein
MGLDEWITSAGSPWCSRRCSRRVTPTPNGSPRRKRPRCRRQGATGSRRLGGLRFEGLGFGSGSEAAGGCWLLVARSVSWGCCLLLACGSRLTLAQRHWPRGADV